MRIKFVFNEVKALEALAFVANTHPGLSALYVSKVFFYAEKAHINKYGRPIVADTYIAMPFGPVPSTLKNYLDGNWQWAAPPEGLADVVSIVREHNLLRLMPGKRGPNLSVLSETDMECLRGAIAFCVKKDWKDLSSQTHFEKAWRNADPNQPMDYADFVDDDNPHHAEILRMVRESAVYGVL